MLWRGSCGVKFLTVLMIFSLFVSQFAQVATPLILRIVVSNITCDETKLENPDEECTTAHETYMLILAYAGVNFGAQFLNYVREIPFAYMSANAEMKIAAMVYAHIQNQSLAFHL